MFMTDEKRLQEYKNQDKICRDKVAIIQPFLKSFAENHNEGTGFYSDVTILCGPGQVNYDYLMNGLPELYKSWQNGKVSIFNVKWAGLTFVLEYDNKVQLGWHPRPIGAFMVYEGRKLEAPFDVAVAVKDLYSAQEYRSALYSNMRASR